MAVTYPRKFRNQLSAQDVLDQVVRDRTAHMATLNRYRFSEQRSCKDLTETIEALNGEPPALVRDLSHHIVDEARHAAWLTDLLCDLGESVGMPPGGVYIDEFTRLVPSATEVTATDKALGTLAAINVAEKRGCEYFAAHIRALDKAPQTAENQAIRDTIAKILPEEAGHVRWGNRKLAELAQQSPEMRTKVEQAKQKYMAIEQAAFESGMDILAGAELRRMENVLKVAETLPVWERPQYLLEKLPEALLAPDLQRTRLDVLQKAWQRDPVAFFSKFLPMFLSGTPQTAA
ncbi:MAG: ferritin-like domain-containing protein [Oscillatoriales cyanobacterium SM2_1_8]|nr:ferritin-like domain-containing protein [Oscillatoriales cyanobacterium SM2_1_8]